MVPLSLSPSPSSLTDSALTLIPNHIDMPLLRLPPTLSPSPTTTLKPKSLSRRSLQELLQNFASSPFPRKSLTDGKSLTAGDDDTESATDTLSYTDDDATTNSSDGTASNVSSPTTPTAGINDNTNTKTTNTPASAHRFYRNYVHIGKYTKQSPINDTTDSDDDTVPSLIQRPSIDSSDDETDDESDDDASLDADELSVDEQLPGINPSPNSDQSPDPLLDRYIKLFLEANDPDQKETVSSRCDYILSTDRHLFFNVAIQEPQLFTSDHRLVIAKYLVRPTKCHRQYLNSRKQMPFKMAKGSSTMSNILFELVLWQVPDPEQRKPYTDKDWISDKSRQLWDQRCSLRRQKKHCKDKARQLVRAIEASLKADRKQHTIKVGEGIAARMTGDKPDQDEACRDLKFWHRHMGDRPQKSTHEDMGKLARI
jgi:hypothetical protein